MKRMTQCERLLDYLEKHDSITPLEAMNELGILRLASRVCDLRKQGYIVIKKNKLVQNRWGEKGRVASYSLGGEIDGRTQNVFQKNN